MRPLVLIPGLEEGPPTGFPFSAGSSLPGPTPTSHRGRGGPCNFSCSPCLASKGGQLLPCWPRQL